MAQAAKDLIEGLDGEAVAHCHRNGELGRSSAHGIDVAEVHHRGLVSQVLHGHIRKVKMYPFDEHVGTQKQVLAFLRPQNGRVVAHPHEGRGLNVHNIGG